MRRSGISALLTGLVLLLAGCIYGFAGGGLPPHVKSVAVLPFENDTPDPLLQRQIYDELRPQVESRLGLRETGENKADAIVRGRIVRYEADIPVAYSSDPTQSSTAQRKLQITVDVEILDQSTGRTLWSRKGLTEEGTYSERASADGRRHAIEKLVSDVIAGAQSQW